MENHATPSAHTPAPWTYSWDEIESVYRIEGNSELPSIADVFYRNTDAEGEANVRLISAAPELLDHLRSMLEMARSVAANWENGDLASAVRNLDRIAAAAEVAIAKAA